MTPLDLPAINSEIDKAIKVISKTPLNNEDLITLLDQVQNPSNEINLYSIKELIEIFSLQQGNKIIQDYYFNKVVVKCALEDVLRGDVPII